MKLLEILIRNISNPNKDYLKAEEDEHYYNAELGRLTSLIDLLNEVTDEVERQLIQETYRQLHARIETELSELEPRQKEAKSRLDELHKGERTEANIAHFASAYREHEELTNLIGNYKSLIENIGEHVTA